MMPPHGNRLTAVVPVHKMSGRMSNLFRWLHDIDEAKLDIRVVLVEDGEDKATLDELKMALKFPFTEVYSGVFESPGLARNFGLNMVKSEWVVFWDSDDLPNPQTVAKELLETSIHVNVLVGRYCIVQSSSNSVTVQGNLKSLSGIAVNPGLWRFVFRTERIGRTRFLKTRMGEDQVFLAELSIVDSECRFSSSNFYNYFVGHENQLTQSAQYKSEIRNSIFDLYRIRTNSSRSITNYSNIMLTKLILIGIRDNLIGVSEAWRLMRVNPREMLRIALTVPITISYQILSLVFRKKLQSA